MNIWTELSRDYGPCPPSSFLKNYFALNKNYCKKNKTKKKKQNKKRETRYLNQLVFNKKIYSLYCFFKQQSTLPRLEVAVPSRNKKSLDAWISVQKVQEHEKGKKSDALTMLQTLHKLF